MDVLVHREVIVDSQKDPDENKAALEIALNKIYEEVIHNLDDNGDDFSVTKPYIVTLMVSPDKQAVSALLMYINQSQEPSWTAF